MLALHARNMSAAHFQANGEILELDNIRIEYLKLKIGHSPKEYSVFETSELQKILVEAIPTLS